MLKTQPQAGFFYGWWKGSSWLAFFGGAARMCLGSVGRDPRGLALSVGRGLAALDSGDGVLGEHKPWFAHRYFCRQPRACVGAGCCDC